MFKSPCTLALFSFAVLAAVSSACSSRENDRVGGDVAIINKTSSALTDGDIATVHGTYGTHCIGHDPNGTDTWVFDRAVPANTTLSVVKGDTACLLSVTGLGTVDGTYLANPALALASADTYSASASAFGLQGQPNRFFGNAKISARTYTSNFTITLLVSDFTTEATSDKSANYAMRSATVGASTVPAPNYDLTLADFGMLKDFDNVVDSVNGNAALVDAEDDPVTGEAYAIVPGALDADDPIEDIADAFDNATANGAIVGPGTELPAASFALDGADLDDGPERTIIIRHTVGTVSAYQLLVITFHP